MGQGGTFEFLTYYDILAIFLAPVDNYLLYPLHVYTYHNFDSQYYYDIYNAYLLLIYFYLRLSLIETHTLFILTPSICGTHGEYTCADDLFFPNQPIPLESWVYDYIITHPITDNNEEVVVLGVDPHWWLVYDDTFIRTTPDQEYWIDFWYESDLYVRMIPLGGLLVMPSFLFQSCFLPVDASQSSPVQSQLSGSHGEWTNSDDVKKTVQKKNSSKNTGKLHAQSKKEVTDRVLNEASKAIAAHAIQALVPATARTTKDASRKPDGEPKKTLIECPLGSGCNLTLQHYHRHSRRRTSAEERIARKRQSDNPNVIVCLDPAQYAVCALGQKCFKSYSKERVSLAHYHLNNAEFTSAVQVSSDTAPATFDSAIQEAIDTQGGWFKQTTSGVHVEVDPDDLLPPPLYDTQTGKVLLVERFGFDDIHSEQSSTFGEDSPMKKTEIVTFGEDLSELSGVDDSDEEEAIHADEISSESESSSSSSDSGFRDALVLTGSSPVVKAETTSATIESDRSNNSRCVGKVVGHTGHSVPMLVTPPTEVIILNITEVDHYVKGSDLRDDLMEWFASLIGRAEPELLVNTVVDTKLQSEVKQSFKLRLFGREWEFWSNKKVSKTDLMKGKYVAQIRAPIFTDLFNFLCSTNTQGLVVDSSGKAYQSVYSRLLSHVKSTGVDGHCIYFLRENYPTTVNTMAYFVQHLQAGSHMFYVTCQTRVSDFQDTPAFPGAKRG